LIKNDRIKVGDNMSSFGSCKGCGKSISFVSVPVCVDCIQKYKPLVQDYIKDHTDASAGEVARETGTPIDIVHFFSSPKYTDEVEEKIRVKERKISDARRSELVRNLASAFNDTKDAEKVVGMKGCYRFITKEYREAHKQRY
jgi:hypothetical protein